jgi:hypothetical protein
LTTLSILPPETKEFIVIDCAAVFGHIVYQTFPEKELHFFPYFTILYFKAKVDEENTKIEYLLSQNQSLALQIANLEGKLAEKNLELINQSMY